MGKKIIRSPLFYVGDKYKIIGEIQTYFPKKIGSFIEPFTGGGSVFLNVDAEKYYLNDIDSNIINLHKMFYKYSKKPDIFFKLVFSKIEKYNLSRSYIEDIVPISLKKEYKKTYYSKFNKEGYNKLKSDFNKNTKKDYLDLYILLIYGFNRMIRFNKNNEFNIPAGNVDFNKNVVNALNNYFTLINDKNTKLYNLDFKEFINKYKVVDDTFFYLDPPYLITFSEYNKLWNEDKEKELLNLLDELDSKNIKFAISNVTHYKGKTNNIFIEWMKKYNFKKIESNYISYHDNSNKEFEEVLVFNY